MCILHKHELFHNIYYNCFVNMINSKTNNYNNYNIIRVQYNAIITRVSSILASHPLWDHPPIPWRILLNQLVSEALWIALLSAATCHILLSCFWRSFMFGMCTQHSVLYPALNIHKALVLWPAINLRPVCFVMSIQCLLIYSLKSPFISFRLLDNLTWQVKKWSSVFRAMAPGKRKHCRAYSNIVEAEGPVHSCVLLYPTPILGFPGASFPRWA